MHPSLLYKLLTLLERLPLVGEFVALMRGILDVLDWQAIGEDIGQGFWDDGGPLPGASPIDQAAYALHHAAHVLVFLGSGFSVDSGIASFRLEDGELPSIYGQQLEPYQMTHADTFETAAEVQLAWHQSWREVMQRAQPHEGQRALVRLSEAVEGKFTFVTQNVDDLLERAAAELGHPDPGALHIHGTLERLRCHDCAQREHEGLEHAYTELPACRHCGGRLRPDVVWFGEAPPEHELEVARRAAQRAEVCLIIGTSALVHPAAEIPMIALHAGARLIEINPRHSLLTEHTDVYIESGAREALVELERALRDQRSS